MYTGNHEGLRWFTDISEKNPIAKDLLNHTSEEVMASLQNVSRWRLDDVCFCLELISRYQLNELTTTITIPKSGFIAVTDEAGIVRYFERGDKFQNLFEDTTATMYDIIHEYRTFHQWKSEFEDTIRVMS